MSIRSTPLPSARELLLEIARRVANAQRAGQSAQIDPRGGYVVRVSNPTTPLERLQLVAARLQGTPVVVMPHKCDSIAEWTARYASVRLLAHWII